PTSATNSPSSSRASMPCRTSVATGVPTPYDLRMPSSSTIAAIASHPDRLNRVHVRGAAGRQRGGCEAHDDRDRAGPEHDRRVQVGDEQRRAVGMAGHAREEVKQTERKSVV